MAFENDATALVTQFKGSSQHGDVYSTDSAHGLYCQNCDFVVGPDGVVQVATRRGIAQVAQIGANDGSISNMDSWYFSNAGVEGCAAVYYSSAQGVKSWDQVPATISGVLIAVTGATVACFVFDGTRMYAVFAGSTGRIGFAGGQVYGLGVGADPLFASPITSSVATIGITQPTTGVITAGLHRFSFVFTTRNGYTGSLNLVSGSVFVPTSFTAADGVHNLQFTITWASIPTYLTPGGTVQVAMTTAANPARYFLVPGATGAVPSGAGTTVITFSISDNDLVEGTEATQRQNMLTAIGGVAPFNPSAIFTYSSRMGYVTIDSAGFPVVYFSNQNAYQELTAAFNGIYLEGKQIPVMGAGIGGICYIATLSGLYSTQDNGGLPATWTPPARVDGSVGVLGASCMISSGGKILLASEKGFYLFRGGAFPAIPLSYWQTPDWDRIAWTQAYNIQVVDDTKDKVLRVFAPLKVVITGATNTNPISITTAILINNVPIARPHLFQSGLSVTIAGVGGNTAANTTAVITVTGDNTFTIPVAGNGAYTSGGVATPNEGNATLCWDYSAGDDPGQPFYSIQAFTSYRAGCMATVRNISNGFDETWYASAASNPGNIVRRVLSTDTLIHQDVDLSGNAVAINAPYETSLLPDNAQDADSGLRDFDGADFRISGSGSLALVAYGLDRVRSVVPAASPLTLSQAPGMERMVKWYLRSERQSIQFSTNAIGAYFIASLIRCYYNNSVPQR